MALRVAVDGRSVWVCVVIGLLLVAGCQTADEPETPAQVVAKSAERVPPVDSRATSDEPDPGKDSGEVPELPAFEIKENLMDISCFGRQGQFITRRTGRTPELVGPDGRYRAYAQVTAVGGPDEKWGKTCSNTARLHVAGPNSLEFRQVFIENAGYHRWNGVRLIDWSADSRYLVLQYQTHVYAPTDHVGYTTVVYDAVEDKSSFVNQYQIFKRHIGIDCDFAADPIGFDASGRIIFQAPGSWPGEDPCVNDGIYAIDHEAATVTQLADDYLPPRHGTYTPASSPVPPLDDSAPSASGPDTQETLLLFCRGTQSVRGRSRTLISPDGRLRAFTESIAIPNLEYFCMNNSRLWISGIAGDTYVAALSLSPDTRPRGNGLRITDWSPSSRYLAFERQIFYYESEYGPADAMILDTKTLRTASIPVSEAFASKSEEQCSVWPTLLGFESDDVVVLSLSEIDEDMYYPSCVPAPSVWRLDLKTQIVERLPDAFRVQKFGRLE